MPRRKRSRRSSTILENSDIRAEEGHPLAGRFVDYPAFFTALAKQRS